MSISGQFGRADAAVLGFAQRRALGLIVVLAAMILVIFLLRQVIPSDPARAAVGPNAPQSIVDAKRKELGLDDPIPTQFARYVGRIFHADLGSSTRTGDPVTTDLRHFLPASLELMIFAIVAGCTLGFSVAVSQTLWARAAPIRLVLLGGASAPVFLSGLLLLLLFWFKLGWFPGGGRTAIVDSPGGPTGFLTIDGLLHGRPHVTLDALRHLVLPGCTLAIPISVAFSRTLRSSLVTVMRQDYVRAARSKGLSEPEVVLRYGVRNASTATLSMIGLQIGLMFANLLIVEQIFAWPGVGLYTVQALSSSDLPAVLGVALLFGAAYVVLNAVVDLVQAWADPRVRL
jgi:ABC-type dipeptide/oligopeptide/nickel transport system permease component